jgi:hypothetical protein
MTDDPDGVADCASVIEMFSVPRSPRSLGMVRSGIACNVHVESLSSDRRLYFGSVKVGVYWPDRPSFPGSKD